MNMLAALCRSIRSEGVSQPRYTYAAVALFNYVGLAARKIRGIITDETSLDSLECRPECTLGPGLLSNSTWPGCQNRRGKGKRHVRVSLISVKVTIRKSALCAKCRI